MNITSHEPQILRAGEPLSFDVVMEVNASPGLEGIEKATGIDVGASIIDYLEEHASRGRTKDRIKG